MGIYSSWWFHSSDDHDLLCAKWSRHLVPGSKVSLHAGEDTFFLDDSVPCSCNAGPLIYQGSHINPGPEDRRGGSVDVAAIPNHCHPSVRASGEAGPPVEFLRLGVREDPTTYQGGYPGDATVVLDRDAVRQLRDVLDLWLNTPDRL